jgi:hypothetical protein
MAFKSQYMTEELEHSFKEINVMISTETINHHAGPTQAVDKHSGLNF